MAPSNGSDIDRFFTAIKSINELDKAKVRNVVGGVLGPSVREEYFTLNYQRAVMNIELVLTLKALKEFQAITMLARAVLETAVEVKLIRSDPDAASRISLFTDVQKLKAARKIVKFKDEVPTSDVDATIYAGYIVQHEARIIKEKAQMWPNAKRLEHWSAMNMELRCKTLGGEYHELYQNHYAQMSWYVHSGVTGVANVSAEALANLCGIAFVIMIKCYVLMLEEVINEFKIYNADEKLKNEITFAKMLPFTNSQSEIDALRRALGL